MVRTCAHRPGERSAFQLQLLQCCKERLCPLSISGPAARRSSMQPASIGTAFSCFSIPSIPATSWETCDLLGSGSTDVEGSEATDRYEAATATRLGSLECRSTVKLPGVAASFILGTHHLTMVSFQLTQRHGIFACPSSSSSSLSSLSLFLV